jgi:hypothetical protein
MFLPGGQHEVITHVGEGITMWLCKLLEDGDEPTRVLFVNNNFPLAKEDL